MKAVYGLLVIGFVFAAPSAMAQGVPIAPGVYGCGGAAQAGPCNGSSNAGSSTSSSGGVIGYAHAAPK